MAASTQDKKQFVLTGLPAAPGHALGHPYLLAANMPAAARKSMAHSQSATTANQENQKLTGRQSAATVQDAAVQKSRLDNAYSRLITKFDNMKRRAQSQQNSEQIDILNLYNTILVDEELQTHAAKLIKEQNITAEKAISRAYLKQIKRFEQSTEEKVRMWALDLYDILNSLLMFLITDAEPAIADIPAEAIIITDEISPSQLIGLPTENIAGIVCERGDPESHAAILAAGMQIPAVFSCQGIMEACRGLDSNSRIMVNGSSGEVVIHPQSSERQYTPPVRYGLDRLPAKTADNVELELLANIVNTDEYRRLQGINYNGTGLLRTEALFAGSSVLPDEEIQFIRYRQAIKLASHNPGPIIIRTFDLAAEPHKSEQDLTIVSERDCSPYRRGLSLSLENIEGLRIQLRAIIRAYNGRDCYILFPLVMSAEDFSRAAAAAQEIYQSVKTENNIHSGKLQIGAMIETPQAVKQAAELFQMADFISIGTNDLASYTEGGLFTRVNLDMIRMLASQPDVQSGRKRIIICGEMAASAEALPLWLQLGLRSFSIAAHRMNEFKLLVSSISIN